MKGKRYDTDTELHALALFARGDTYEQVSAATTISVSALQNIKGRNKAILDIIHEKMVEHQITSSKKILHKAHGLIEKRLDKAERDSTQVDKAIQELLQLASVLQK